MATIKDRPGAGTPGGPKKSYSDTLSQRIPIYNESGTRIVGYVRGTTFTKSVAPHHYLKYPTRAIAWDISAITEAQGHGVTYLYVIDRDSGKAYTATVEQFWRNGRLVDRGHGKQWALPLSEWSAKPKNQTSLF